MTQTDFSSQQLEPPWPRIRKQRVIVATIERAEIRPTNYFALGLRSFSSSYFTSNDERNLWLLECSYDSVADDLHQHLYNRDKTGNLWRKQGTTRRDCHMMRQAFGLCTRYWNGPISISTSVWAVPLFSWWCLSEADLRWCRSRGWSVLVELIDWLRPLSPSPCINFKYKQQIHDHVYIYIHTYITAARSIYANPSRSDRLRRILLEDEPCWRTNVTVCWSWVLYHGFLRSLQIRIGLDFVESKEK